MTPLGAVALGLVLVLLDLRMGGLDVVPDALGWALVVGGVTRLGRFDAAFRRCRPWALLALVLSLADLVHPQEARTTGGPGLGTTTTTAVVVPDGLHGLLVGGYGLASIVVAVLLCVVLRDRARQYADALMERRFSMFVVLQVAAGVLVVAGMLIGLVAGDGGSLAVGGGAAGLTLLLVLAGLAMQVWFIATLHAARDRPWLQDAEPVREDPALSD